MDFWSYCGKVARVSGDKLVLDNIQLVFHDFSKQVAPKECGLSIKASYDHTEHSLQHEDEIRSQGRAAYLNELQFSACPYKDDERHRLWNEGYMIAADLRNTTWYKVVLDDGQELLFSIPGSPTSDHDKISEATPQFKGVGTLYRNLYSGSGNDPRVEGSSVEWVYEGVSIVSRKNNELV